MKITVATFGALAVLVATAPAALADDTGFASMHELRKERGRLCMADHAHSGVGEGKTREAARRAALASWYGYTAGEYGSDWARWGRSAAQTVSYTKADSGWSATVESRPCR